MSDLPKRIENWLQIQQEQYGPTQPHLWGASPEKTTDSGTTSSPRNKNAASVPADAAGPSHFNPMPRRKPSDEDVAAVASLRETLASIGSLDELRAFCATYKPLRTDLPNTNLVFGVGNPDADLMLVGEAPGENEDLQGEPFVGKAGQLLNQILQAIGFERDDVYIANILKHRPPNNRDPLPEERMRSLPVLERQIDLIKPKIILCLGRISAQTLLDRDEPMKSLRGSFHDYRGYELTLTYHPAALLRNESWKRHTWDDVRMVRNRYDELGGKPEARNA